MMARPYRNVIRIQYGGYIMGMHTVHSEGEYPAVLCSIRRAKDPDAGDLLHSLKGQYGQFIFSLLQPYPADFFQISDCSFQGRRTRGIYRPRFEFMGEGGA